MVHHRYHRHKEGWSSSGYLADSLSDFFGEGVVGGEAHQHPEELSEAIPMDYSPLSSDPQEVMVSSKGKLCSLKLKIVRQKDKMWNWVKVICPSKRKGLELGELEVDQGSVMVSGCLPLKKRKSVSVSGEDVMRVSPVAGGQVAGPSRPPEVP